MFKKLFILILVIMPMFWSSAIVVSSQTLPTTPILVAERQQIANTCNSVITVRMYGFKPWTYYNIYRSSKVDYNPNCPGVTNTNDQNVFWKNVLTDDKGYIFQQDEVAGYGRFDYTVIDLTGISYIGTVFTDLKFTTQGSSVRQVCPSGLQSRLAVGYFAKVVSAVNVRIKPGIKNPLAKDDPFKPGDELHIIDGPRCVDVSTWWRVTFDYVTEGYHGKVTGWVAEGTVIYLLEPENKYQAPLPAVPLPQGLYLAVNPNIFNNVNVRSTPFIERGNTLWNIIGRLMNNGTVYHVIGRDSENNWLLVEYQPGQYGWACEIFANYNFDINQLTIYDYSGHPCEEDDPN